jgi:hypothetical protein
MDKLKKYRQIIKDYISRHVEIFNQPKSADVEAVAVFDDKGGNYQWLSVGWKNGKRVFNTIVYVRLHNEKIYIEEDFSEYGIGNELVEKGVPKSDIVLAFQEPSMRQYTEFAMI